MTDPHQANPKSTDDYRESTKQMLIYSHVRKRCPTCSTTVTEKLMRRFGGCEKCWRIK